MNLRYPIQLTGLLTGLFVVGLLAGAILREGSSFRSVWVRSYLKMHSSLTRVASDDRLIVMHSDLQALKRLADGVPWVVSVAESGFANVAYVVIDESEPGRLAQLRGAPFVQFVLRNRLVFFVTEPELLCPA